MPKRNTKQIIVIESLRLFSQKGYEGVSVRDIAAAVGIRESSLYKHYKSKQEIFDSIIVHMKEKYLQSEKASSLPSGDMNNIAKQYKQVDIEQLKQMTRSMFMSFVNDEFMCMFRKMVMMEQFRNESVKQIHQSFFIDEPIQFQSTLFELMMAHGAFKKSDARTMALHFYAPIYMLMNRYDEKDDIELALQILDQHVEQFANIYQNHV